MGVTCKSISNFGILFSRKALTFCLVNSMFILSLCRLCKPVVFRRAVRDGSALRAWKNRGNIAMKKVMMKAFSLVITLCMVVAMLPLAALADAGLEPGGADGYDGAVLDGYGLPATGNGIICNEETECDLEPDSSDGSLTAEINPSAASIDICICELPCGVFFDELIINWHCPVCVEDYESCEAEFKEIVALTVRERTIALDLYAPNVTWVDANGVVQTSPTGASIDASSEGWRWYKGQDAVDAGFANNTLVLEDVTISASDKLQAALLLPAASTIIFSGYNTVKNLATTGSPGASVAAGIATVGMGTLTIMGEGTLHAYGPSGTAYSSAGIYAGNFTMDVDYGAVYAHGGNPSGAGNSMGMNVGNILTITGGAIEAEGGNPQGTGYSVGLTSQTYIMAFKISGGAELRAYGGYAAGGSYGIRQSNPLDFSGITSGTVIATGHSGALYSGTPISRMPDTYLGYFNDTGTSLRGTFFNSLDGLTPAYTWEPSHLRLEITSPGSSVTLGTQTPARTFGEAGGDVVFAVATTVNWENLNVIWAAGSPPAGVTDIRFSDNPPTGAKLAMTVASTTNAGSYGFTVISQLGGIHFESFGSLVIGVAEAHFIITPVTSLIDKTALEARDAVTSDGLVALAGLPGTVEVSLLGGGTAELEVIWSVEPAIIDPSGGSYIITGTLQSTGNVNAAGITAGPITFNITPATVANPKLPPIALQIDADGAGGDEGGIIIHGTGGSGGVIGGTVTIPASLVNNRLTASMSGQLQRELAGFAYRRAVEEGCDSIPVVTLFFSDVEGVTTAVLPTAAISTFSKADVSLEIEMPLGTIYLDQHATSSLASQARGREVSFTLSMVSYERLNVNQRAAVGESSVVFQVAVNSGGETVSEFGNGELTISLKYGGPIPAAVRDLDEEGGLQRLYSLWDDEAGTMTFVERHLSYYAVSYVGGGPHWIRLQLGENAYNIDGMSSLMDVAPVLESGRALVPLRFVAEALGAEVDWSGETRTATVMLDGRVLAVTVDQLLLGMDVPARQINGRTMVPLRFISEYMGYVVYWHEASREIDIIQG